MNPNTTHDDGLEPVLPSALEDVGDVNTGDDDIDLIDEDPDEGEEAPRARPRPRRLPRRRAARAVAAAPAAAAVAPEDPPAEMEEEPEREAAQRDFDTWASMFDWDKPQMKAKLKRFAPANYRGLKIAGFLDEKLNEAFTEAEIAGRFGGGTYEMAVAGFDRKNKYRQLGHKQVHIAGEPRLTDDSMPSRSNDPNYDPADDFYLDEGPALPPSHRMPPRPVRRRPAYLGPAVSEDDGTKRQSLEMLEKQFEWMRDRSEHRPGDETQSLQHAEMLRTSFENAAGLQISGAQKMLAEKDRIVDEQRKLADKEVDMAAKRLQEAREERDKAIAEANMRAETFRAEREQTREELRKIEGQMSQERTRIQDDMAKRLDEVRASGNQLLALLLPQQQSQAQAQLDMTMKMYEARLQNMEARHTSQLTSLEKSYELRMSTQADLFKTQIVATQTMYEGRGKQLEHDLTVARDEVKTLTNRLDDVRKELITEVQRATKAASPGEQLTQLGALVETITGIQDVLGSGKKEGGDDLTDGLDSPIAKTGARLLDKFIGVVPNITEAIATLRNQPANAGPQGGPTAAQGWPQPMMLPQVAGQPQMQQYQQQQQQQQQQPRRRVSAGPPAPGMLPPVGGPQPVQAPTAVPKPKRTPVSKEALVTAVRYINSALEQPTPPAPDDFARAAMGVVDNATLRELAKRPADRVVSELETAGILTGRAASEEGRVFVVEVLKALKTKVL